MSSLGTQRNWFSACVDSMLRKKHILTLPYWVLKQKMCVLSFCIYIWHLFIHVLTISINNSILFDCFICYLTFLSLQKHQYASNKKVLKMLEVLSIRIFHAHLLCHCEKTLAISTLHFKLMDVSDEYIKLHVTVYR